jgi:hypothetical protein
VWALWRTSRSFGVSKKRSSRALGHRLRNAETASLLSSA